MDMKKSEPKKLSTTNTKQEMLEAYNLVLKQLREKEESELKPEKRMEEKRVAEVLKTAESVATDGVAAHIGGLKTEIGQMLGQVSDKLETEAAKLSKVQQAAQIEEKELHERSTASKRKPRPLRHSSSRRPGSARNSNREWCPSGRRWRRKCR